MSDKLKFKVFCFEMYKTDKKLNGFEAEELFEKYKVYDYLDEVYDVLHTTGHKYIINDIDEYINIRKNK